MRVALVFSNCHRSGGVERIMWEAARFLSDRHDVFVVAERAEDLPTGVRHVPVTPGRGPGLLAPWRFRRAAAEALRSTEADVRVVYGSQCPPGDVYVINSVHRSWLRKAGATEVRGTKVPGWARYLLPHTVVALGMERSYYRQAKGKQLVPCAAQVAEDLGELYGLAANPVTVVHNGFSPEEFSPERRAQLRPAARDELGYGDGDVVLVMAANEWRRKGLTVVLKAMAEVGDPRLQLLLIGRSDPTAFLDQFDRPEVLRRVRYLGPSSDVAVQHAAADLFVLPTQYEAFCLAIIEALADALPVITTTVPGAGDAIVDGVNGLLLTDPQDAGELAALLRRALDGRERRSWGEAAAPSVEPYRWDTLMATFEAVLTTVVGTPRT